VHSERRNKGPRPKVYYSFGSSLLPGDLIFEGSQPILVISWRTVEDQRVPYIAFPLDPAHLKPLGNQPDGYLYEVPPAWRDDTK
jgi:hypothetical protein